VTKRIRKPPKTSVPQRANNSPTRWKEGTSGNPGGRAKLPDWFKGHGESALAMLVAAGTGRVVTLDEDTDAELAARQAMADGCPANIRSEAANRIADRLYGKVKETVAVEGENGQPVERVVRFIVEAAAEKPVVDGRPTIEVKRTLS